MDKHDKLNPDPTSLHRKAEDLLKLKKAETHNL
jgi:hypothetical protein